MGFFRIRAQSAGVSARQRHERGNDHRAGGGHGELAEQDAGGAGLERDREKDGHQRDGDRDDSGGDFAGATDGGFERRNAILDMPVDVF